MHATPVKSVQALIPSPCIRRPLPAQRRKPPLIFSPTEQRACTDLLYAVEAAVLYLRVRAFRTPNTTESIGKFKQRWILIRRLRRRTPPGSKGSARLFVGFNRARRHSSIL